MSVTKKVALSFFVMALILFFVGTILLQNPETKAPLINGVIIPEAKPLKPFAVVDHNNASFTNKQLKGRWHLVSYGYTHCPDICPNTLNILASLVKKLKTEKLADDLNVLFYSIDYQRDTVEHLAGYVPFFHESFIGLTSVEKTRESALAFEESLGMISVLTPVESSAKELRYESYSVSHGVMLYLLNPEGKLQAVFKPEKNKQGVQHFTVEQLYTDYVAVINYFSLLAT